MPKIVLYMPKKGSDDKKWNEIRRIVKEESEILGIGYDEKIGDEEYPIVYLEDNESTTFIYIEDSQEDDIENIRAMIRVLTLVALLTEDKTEKDIVEEKEVIK